MKEVDAIVLRMTNRLIGFAAKGMTGEVTPESLLPVFTGLVRDLRALVELCPNTAAGLLTSWELSLQLRMACLETPAPPTRRARRAPTEGGTA